MIISRRALNSRIIFEDAFRQTGEELEPFLYSVFDFLKRTTDTMELDDFGAKSTALEKEYLEVQDTQQVLEWVDENEFEEDDDSSHEEEDCSEVYQKCRLLRKPHDLKTLVDILYHYTDTPRIVDTGEDCSITLAFNPTIWPKEDENFGFYPQFRLNLESNNGTSQFSLIIASASIAIATKCLNYIVDLDDDYFDYIALSQYESCVFTSRVYICPLDRVHLRKFATSLNPARRIGFQRLGFSPRQGKRLGTCNSNGGITFNDCRFLSIDKGAAFTKAFLSSPVGPTSPPRRFEFVDHFLPFDESNFNLFLSGLPENSELSFRAVHFESFQIPRVPNIDLLHFKNCNFHDGFSMALSKALATNTGPKRLMLEGHGCRLFMFSEEEKAIEFFEALAPNERLKELYLPDLMKKYMVQSLANSLRRNQGLVRLDLELHMGVGDQLVSDLISSVSAHPTLRVFNITSEFDAFVQESRSQQELLTRAVETMLRVNKVVEEMTCSCLFDEDMWYEEISPRLEINRFQKKLRAFHQDLSEPRQAVLLSHAMSRVVSRPSLLWLLLKQMQGIVLKT